MDHGGCKASNFITRRYKELKRELERRLEQNEGKLELFIGSIKIEWLCDINPNSEYSNFKSGVASREADLQETKAALQSITKKVFEIKDKAEALHDTAEIKQCQALIRFISRELRYVEYEFYKLYLQAVLWLLLFIAEKCDWTSRSLPVRVLSISQALEMVLIASGDVEKNPGPIFLDGN